MANQRREGDAGLEAGRDAPERFVDAAGRVYLAAEEIGRSLLTSVRAATDAADGTALALKTVLPLWIGHPHAEARIARELEVADTLAAAAKAGRGGDGLRLCSRVVAAGRQPCGDARTRPFNVALRLHGAPLADRLRGGDAIAPSSALRWIDDALAALGCLHEAGWVHRDVKPHNLFLAPPPGEPSGLLAGGAGPRACLLDFGLAVRPWAWAGAGAGAGRTDDEPFGTPAYVSPEVIASAPIDARADLYCVGLVLFELVTGRRPFAGRDPIALLDAHLSEPPPRLRALCPERSFSGELERLLAATLEKAPGDRPASAAELRAHLQGVPEWARAEDCGAARPA